MNDFQVVSNWNRIAGVPFPSRPTLANKAEVDLAIRLIEEELQELKDAYEAEDIIEFADALGDLIVVVHGAGHRTGIDVDKVFNIVMPSNFSKFDYNVDDATTSQLAYEETEGEGFTHIIKVEGIDDEPDTFVIKRSSDNKTLKSYKFTPPDLSFLTAT